jgi:predicted Zn-ribbon and HTH transcriptional regulator
MAMPSKCPKCNLSEFISGDSFEAEFGDVWQPMVCDNCGYTWNDVYEYHHTEDAESGEVI